MFIYFFPDQNCPFAPIASPAATSLWHFIIKIALANSGHARRCSQRRHAHGGGGGDPCELLRMGDEKSLKLAPWAELTHVGKGEARQARTVWHSR
jgi:hypothetical protein